MASRKQLAEQNLEKFLDWSELSLSFGDEPWGVIAQGNHYRVRICEVGARPEPVH